MVLNLEIEQNQSENKLVFFAHNLGKYAPNTSAVIIEASRFSKQITLNSDFNQSDVIYFDLEK